MWSALKRDLVVRAGAVLLPVLAVPFFLPFRLIEPLESLYWYHSDLPFLLFALWALLDGATRDRPGPSRRFWRWVLAACTFWLAVVLMGVLLLDHMEETVFSLATDFLYLGFYLCLIAASEVAPFSPHGSRPSALSDRFELAGTAVFTFGLMVYFVLLPVVINTEAYDSWFPSFFLYVTLDLYLALRFAQLARLSTLAGWRTVFRLFFWTAVLWSTLDLAEPLMIHRAPESPFEIELLWALPLVTLALAARLRHAVEEEEGEVLVGEATGVTVRVRESGSNRPASRLLLYAFSFQILHLGLYGFGLLDDATRQPREVLAFFAMVTLGVMAYVQHRVFAREARELKTQRRKAEERTRLLEAAIDGLPLGISITDPEHRLVYVNPAEARMHGYQVGEILGRSYRAPARGQSAPEGRRETVELRKDSTSFPVQLISEVLTGFDGTAQATVTSCEDITERKRIEAALRRSEQEYRGLFENAHDAILILQPEGEIVLEANPQACRMYGFEREELLGLSLETLSKDLEYGRARVDQVLQDGFLHHFETVQCTKQGAELVLEINATSVHYRGRRAILSINHDITARKWAERSLRESEQRYRRLVETSPDAILLDQDGDLVFINPAGLRMFGFDRLPRLRASELLGLLEPDSRDLQPAVQAGMRKPSLPLERRLVGRRGEARDLELTFSASSYQGRSATLIVARDVSEIKKLRQQAQRMEHLAALGQLSTTVAHEIRNPLGSISLNFRFLSDHLEVPRRFRQTVEDIGLGIERIQRTIRGILDFARPLSPTMSRESAEALLQASLRSQRQAFREAGIEIRESYAPEGLEVLVDPGQIVQVFTNLLDNAKNAMTEGGTLTIASRAVDDLLEVRLEDSGKGIAPGDVTKIFQPFFTTRTDGTGLGLAVVARILEQHGIDLEVVSEPGRGTVFVLRFPALRPEAPAEAAASGANEESEDAVGTSEIGQAGEGDAAPATPFQARGT